MSNTRFKKCRANIGRCGLFLAVVLAQGCASSGGSKAELAARRDFALPAPGKVKVIFVRPTKNGGIDVGVHDGEALVAKLPGKSYGVHECDPGPHVFSGSFGNLDILNADLLPDRIYYVKAVLKLQAFGPAWVKITPIHPGAAGKDWKELPRTLAKVEKSVVTPGQAERDRKGIDRYMERLKVYRDKPGAVLEKMLPEHGQTSSLYSP